MLVNISANTRGKLVTSFMHVLIIYVNKLSCHSNCLVSIEAILLTTYSQVRGNEQQHSGLPLEPKESAAVLRWSSGGSITAIFISFEIYQSFLTLDFTGEGAVQALRGSAIEIGSDNG